MLFIHGTLLIVVSVIVTLGAQFWHLAGLRLIHTIPDTTCLPTSRACPFCLRIWNVPYLGIFLCEHSKYSDPVYLMLPSRRDCLFSEIRRKQTILAEPRTPHMRQ